MSSATPKAIYRYALVGVRPAVEDIILKLREIRQQFPRLTNAATGIAAMIALLEELDQRIDTDAGARRSPAPRAAPRQAPSPSPSPRAAPRQAPDPDPDPSTAGPGIRAPSRARPRRERSQRGAASSSRLTNGAQRAWKVGRETLTALSMALEGLTIQEAVSMMSVSPLAARWRLDAVTGRRQAFLARKEPRLYKITDLGKRALAEDKDLRL